MKKVVLAAAVAVGLCFAASIQAQVPDSALAVSKNGQTLLRVNVDGKVGIGTSNPAQKLTVTGGLLVDSQSVTGPSRLGSNSVIVERVSNLPSATDSIFTVRNGADYGFRVHRDGGLVARGLFNNVSQAVPAEGSGVRLVWYPGKAAFRAGGINGTQWDDANIGDYSVAMGQDVRALGNYGFAMGFRAVAANNGTVAIGEEVTATGANSVAIGYRASTSTGAGSPRLGSFVFGDRSTSSTGDTVHATLTNAAYWRVANGMYIWTASNLSSGVAIQSGSSTTSPWCSITNAMISASNCAYLSSGGTWTNSSDRNRKHSFAYVSGEDILAKLRSVPITSWTYNSDADQVRHLGPTAQDFHKAFSLGGSDDTHIATIDADGVALAAAKALDARTTALQAKVESQQKEIDELKAMLAKLQAAMKR